MGLTFLLGLELTDSLYGVYKMHTAFFFITYFLQYSAPSLGAHTAARGQRHVSHLYQRCLFGALSVKRCHTCLSGERAGTQDEVAAGSGREVELRGAQRSGEPPAGGVVVAGPLH